MEWWKPNDGDWGKDWEIEKIKQFGKKKKKRRFDRLSEFYKEPGELLCEIILRNGEKAEFYRLLDVDIFDYPTIGAYYRGKETIWCNCLGLRRFCEFLITDDGRLLDPGREYNGEALDKIENNG